MRSISIYDGDEFEAIARDVKRILSLLSELIPEEKSKILTTEQVCKKLGITSRTLQTMRDTGKIAFINSPGSRTIRYMESDIDSYLKNNTIRARSPKYA